MLRTLFASLPDREKVVFEIWEEDIQVAEVSYETGTPKIEIYPHPRGEPWNFELSEWCCVVKAALDAKY